MNPHQKPQEDVVGQAMAESVGLLWAMLPEQHDVVCGHGMPEGCRQYWRDLAAIGLAAGHEAGRRDMREAAGWQPIETAPDDTDVLVCLPRHGIDFPGNPLVEMAVGTLIDGAWYSDRSQKPEYQLYQPTHWMPLPTEPLGGESPQDNSDPE